MISIPIWFIFLFVALLVVVAGMAVILETRIEQLTGYIKRLEKERDV